MFLRTGIFKHGGGSRRANSVSRDNIYLELFHRGCTCIESEVLSGVGRQSAVEVLSSAFARQLYYFHFVEELSEPEVYSRLECPFISYKVTYSREFLGPVLSNWSRASKKYVSMISDALRYRQEGAGELQDN